VLVIQVLLLLLAASFLISFRAIAFTVVYPANTAGRTGTSMRTKDEDEDEAGEILTASTAATATATATTSLADTCRQTPWTEACAEWYNDGNWTVLPSPLEWHQTYSQQTMGWNSSRFATPSECQRVGTSLQWQSNTHNPSVWDADRFLRALGPDKRIVIVGDSVARQHYATFLEALGDNIQNCTGFDYGWGPRSPLSCQTTAHNVTIDTVTDNYGSWDGGIGPWDGGIRGKSYNGTAATQDYFRGSHLIVLNFGIWYYEQVEAGQQTNHTVATYIRHMQTVADDIARHRQPHQLVVWRETTGPRKPNHEDIKAANRALRPYMALRQIPVIYDHSSMSKSGPLETTVAHLYLDWIHFCEPALQMAWTSILSHIVQDYNWERVV
jgi:hypothetical protein